jgi:hypothetical protein
VRLRRVVLRDVTGKVSCLEKADISKLVAAGWQPPIPFSVKARDGKTDLYGMMFRPTKFDPAKKYPIIPRLSRAAGRQRGRSFVPARLGHQALAELASSSSLTGWAPQAGRSLP